MSKRIIFKRSQAQKDAEIQAAIDAGYPPHVPADYEVLKPSGNVTPEHVLENDVPADATDARIIDVSDLPVNRNYRNAWDDSNPESFVGVNTAKAGEIAHGRRRDKRALLFNPNLEICAVAAMGLPLKSGQNSTDASNTMTTYKANLDDVAQIAIDAAVVADDVNAIEAAEIVLGTVG